VLDPFGKIPEFKYCAVRVTAGGDLIAHSSFGGGQILAGEVRYATNPQTGSDT
jgi:formate dehydrogenase major subunit